MPHGDGVEWPLIHPMFHPGLGRGDRPRTSAWVLVLDQTFVRSENTSSHPIPSPHFAYGEILLTALPAGRIMPA